MEQEVRHGETEFTREFKIEAVRLIKERGVSYAQAAEDVGVHPTQLRDWVRKLADDPQHAFLGNDQMNPEQQEIAQLKREAARLKAERDILKKAAAYFAKGVDVKFAFIAKHRGIWPATSVPTSNGYFRLPKDPSIMRPHTRCGRRSSALMSRISECSNTEQTLSHPNKQWDIATKNHFDFNELLKAWRSLGESNPRFSLERAAS